MNKIKEISYIRPLQKGSSVFFTLNDSSQYIGRVAGNSESGIFIVMGELANAALFHILGIPDKNKFVSQAIGHALVFDGQGEKGWPEVGSIKELEKVLEALKKWGREPNETFIKININKTVKLNFKL